MTGRKRQGIGLADDPLWFKDAVLYELHVKAFCDSSGDGMGDFNGLSSKLDYLQDLGVTALWLLPFSPSPLRDDGYDVADYTGVHPAYGTIRDFKEFLREAHRRGLRVITELVLNHTSDQHPWFQRARRAKPSSRHRQFYVWSDTPDRYPETRIIFKDFEPSNWSWDPVAKAYYWHRFYAHQPDLNYDNPLVQKAMFRVMDFWLGLGVDGVRMDAVPYLYERDGTNCENLPETYEFLKRLRAHVDRRFRNKMLLAEANQWPEDAVAYFGEGNECHMAFHFPLMPRMFMALRMEDRFPIVDILNQTPAIPESCQWALFLRNHDELTLEMVTDEERDFMYRVYAQDPQMRINLGIRRRLAPLLGNHRRRIELMNGLLFSLPGTPIVYYGDEIGMGDNVYLGDRNGVRTPMQWSADRNAGFSRANPHRLYLPVIIDPEYHHETVNVEAQLNNSHSLLWWMKRLIGLRRRFKAFSRGSLEFLRPENRKVLAFVRRHQEERLLVVANLSRFAQYVELDLSEYSGWVPVECFGRTEFPPIGTHPYLLTLGPHSFYWFVLMREVSPAGLSEGAPSGLSRPVLKLGNVRAPVLHGRALSELEDLLPAYLRACRWFRGKARPIKSVRVIEVLSLSEAPESARIAMVRVEYVDGDGETYVLPVAHGSGEEARRIQRDHPSAVIARVRWEAEGEEGMVYDAMYGRGFAAALLEFIGRHRRRRGTEGELSSLRTDAYHRILGKGDQTLDPVLLKAEQSNTSIAYGDRFILKLFRQLQPGVNPDLELGRFLTERECPLTPPVAGAVEYRQNHQDPLTVAILHGFTANQGDAWEYTKDVLSHYFELVVAHRARWKEISAPQEAPLDLLQVEPPPFVGELIGPYLESARLLGRRTAELHVLLASEADDPNFAPEPFSTLYQRALYQSMRNLTVQVLGLLHQRRNDLPERFRPLAREVLEREEQILEMFRVLTKRKITAMRIRCHGDLHLGQVLHTGKDFVIIDFEGEPVRPITERRIKRCPLRDVAGMLRSFHYASQSSLLEQVDGAVFQPEDLQNLENGAVFWHVWVSVAYLTAYRKIADEADFLPHSSEEFQMLLDIYLLEKAVYELGYELNNRPGWVGIPLKGVQQILRAAD